MTSQHKGCIHTVGQQKFDKMFINDNGDFGGQHITVILRCQCGYMTHIHSYRGNVPKEYIKPNSGSYFSSRDEDKDFIQQEVW